MSKGRNKENRKLNHAAEGPKKLQNALNGFSSSNITRIWVPVSHHLGPLDPQSLTIGFP